jgi:S-adenosylmethionine:tRNA ribosyltransferase-isomerase
VDYLAPGDLLVLNNSKVIPARLHGINKSTSGRFELFLLEENAPNDWWVLMRPGKRGRRHTQIVLTTKSGAPSAVIATVTDINPEGHRRVSFTGTTDLLSDLHQLGETPLPPYISRPADSDAAAAASAEDQARYQTVYAQQPGSVAAPTAGLHFTESLLQEIADRGVHTASVTLHVGYGTFAPIKVEDTDAHVMHEEKFSVPAQAADEIAAARQRHNRVIAVGTTSLRVLESLPELRPTHGRTRLFVRPPYPFRFVDALITNFHLPGSTLLMLVSAFADPGGTAGRDRVLAAYAEAIRHRYRFFSYGDAMLII